MKVLAVLKDGELLKSIKEKGVPAGVVVETPVEGAAPAPEEIGLVLADASVVCSADPIFAMAKAFDVPILVLGRAEDASEVLKLIEAGARGYVPLPQSPGQIVERLRLTLMREEERRGSFRIQKAKSELQAAFDALPQALVVVGPDRRIRRANRAALELSGRKAFQSLLGEDCKSVFGCGADSQCPASRPTEPSSGWAGARRPEGESSASGTFVSLTFQGLPQRVLRCHGFGPGKEPSVSNGLGDGTLVLIEDASERIRQDAERARKEQLEAVWLLAATLSHEINQPLGTIMGRAQLALLGLEREEGGRQELKRNLEEIILSVQRIAGILDKLHRVTDIITKPYLGETRILDLDRSAHPKGTGGRG